MTIILLIISLVPQEYPAKCGTIEVNHIRRVREIGNQLVIRHNSYVLGRRDRKEFEGIEVIDWWRKYNKEKVWQNGHQFYMNVWDKYQKKYVIVTSNRYVETYTEYDVEVDQKRQIYEEHGLKAEEYRRGLQ